MEIFKEYSAKKNESAWVQLLTLLNRPGAFIMNMTARVIAKIACWSKQSMDGSDLNFYLTWLKDQLKTPVSAIIVEIIFRFQVFFEVIGYCYN